MSSDDTDQSVETVEVPKEVLWEMYKSLSHPRKVLRNQSEYGNTWEDRSRAQKGKEQVEEVRETLEEFRSVEPETSQDGGSR